MSDGLSLCTWLLGIYVSGIGLPLIFKKQEKSEKENNEIKLPLHPDSRILVGNELVIIFKLLE